MAVRCAETQVPYPPHYYDPKLECENFDVPCMYCNCQEGERANDPFILCDGVGCYNGGHVNCMHMTGVPKGHWRCVVCVREGIAVRRNDDDDDNHGGEDEGDSDDDSDDDDDDRDDDEFFPDEGERDAAKRAATAAAAKRAAAADAAGTAAAATMEERTAVATEPPTPAPNPVEPAPAGAAAATPEQPAAAAAAAAGYWKRLGELRAEYLPRVKERYEVLKKKAKGLNSTEQAHEFLSWMNLFLIATLQQTEESPYALAKFTLEELNDLEAG